MFNFSSDSGSGHLQFVVEHSDQRFLYMFWSWYPLLHPGLPRSHPQPSGWTESLCRSLHSGELHSSWQVRSHPFPFPVSQSGDHLVFFFQHNISDGPCQAVEKHVRQDEVGRHRRDDRRLRPHAVLGVLVEEERAGLDVRGDSILCDDLVLHLIHSLRQRRLL